MNGMLSKGLPAACLPGFLALCLVGCGGGESAVQPTAEPSTTTPAGGDQTNDLQLPTGESSTPTAGPSRSDPPPKNNPMNGGLTLPDNLEMPAEDASPGAGDKPAGLELPPELSGKLDTPPVSESLASSVAPTSGNDSVADHGYQFVTTQSKIQYATWTEFMGQAVKPGQITVVDLWSLSCIPCLKEFPNLVKLQQSFPEQVKAVGVNLDFDGRKKHPPESYEAKASKFLEYVNAEFDNYILKTPNDEVFKEAKIGSLPAVLVFNAKGEMVGKFVEAGETLGFSYESDVVPLVERLIAE